MWSSESRHAVVTWLVGTTVSKEHAAQATTLRLVVVCRSLITFATVA